jgi:hypothetical protein
VVQKNTIDKEYKMTESTENIESTESTEIPDEYKNTHAYTYKVTMLVQIIAPTKEIADAKLDKDGGYVSKRDVEFKYSTVLYDHTLQDLSELDEEKDK